MTRSGGVPCSRRRHLRTASRRQQMSGPPGFALRPTTAACRLASSGPPSRDSPCDWWPPACRSPATRRSPWSSGLRTCLTATERWTRDWGRERGRDPGLYYLAVFGLPDGDAWGWRFGGHHVSLNYTVIAGRVKSCTPSFIGAHPARSVLLADGTFAPARQPGGGSPPARAVTAGPPRGRRLPASARRLRHRQRQPRLRRRRRRDDSHAGPVARPLRGQAPGRPGRAGGRCRGVGERLRSARSPQGRHHAPAQGDRGP